MAKNVFLEFESDIEALEGKIAELRELEESTADHEQRVSVDKEIQQLQKKATQLVKKVYADLTPWQISQVARHPNRPYTLDYIESIFTDFHELHGDRAFADDKAIVGGLARLANMNVVVIGHQKGRTLKERTERNFGMARPEGYRKALRLMEMAEKFGLPVVTLIDTPGAYPGIDAEERGQSEAIGHNIYKMAELSVPILSCVIGEGGSGGALAIGVSDTMLMLQYATYSVISPEGCASILWKSASEAPRAAEALGLTANRLKELGLVDRVITEPLGGAHRDWQLMSINLKKAMTDELRKLTKLSREELITRRHERLNSFGRFSVEAASRSQKGAKEAK